MTKYIICYTIRKPPSPLARHLAEIEETTKARRSNMVEVLREIDAEPLEVHQTTWTLRTGTDNAEEVLDEIVAKMKRKKTPLESQDALDVIQISPTNQAIK